MRNAIKFYYGLDVDEIKNDNGIFLFKNYMLKELKNSIDFDLYYMILNNGIKIHRIVFNKEKEYYTKINNKIYVLYYLCDYKDINLKEISEYSNLLVNINTNNKDFINLWQKKVDYYESKLLDMGNKEILEIAPYYIGLSELAIRIFKENEYPISYGISHRRINSFYDFFCPDNIIVDCIARDYSEYFKTIFFKKREVTIYQVMEMVNKISFKPGDYIVFFSRMLFPTYYYDCIESSMEMSVYTSKIGQYEVLLANINYKLYEMYGVEIIEWLKKRESNLLL